MVHQGDTIPNLYFYTKIIRYDEFDYYGFMLFYNDKGQVNIIYQLEHYPEWKNSHTEPDGTKLYGTHIHELTKTYEIRPDNLFDWQDWLVYYMNLINLTLTGKIIAPYQKGLFDE